jgi:transposase-like protein
MIKNNKGGSQKITCPNCEHQFAWGDAQISEEQKAIYTLHQHGYSIRSIGRMFSLAPESVRYRLKELNRNKYVAPTKSSTKLGGK